MKPSQIEFDIALKVLLFMLTSTEKHEPYATEPIQLLKGVHEQYSFTADDYEEV